MNLEDELRRLYKENQKLQQQLGEAVWNYGEKVRANQELVARFEAQQPAQGCDYCNHHQYAGIKCKNCGREQPAQQQEPIAWMKDCADFWEHYTYISEASQENYKAEAQMWVEKLRTSPLASKPWVELTEFDIDQIPYSCSHADSRLIAYAIEAKLREKNA